jgi:anti-sigma factor RsiW
MKCEQCRALVEEYFDGELDPSASEQVGAHIAKCAACAGLVAGIRQEHELYTMYRRDVSVTPALWAAVEGRIAEEKRIEAQKHGKLARVWEWLREGLVAPRLSPRLAVALVVVAIGITVGVMSYVQSRNQSGEGVTVVQLQPNDSTSTSVKEKPEQRAQFDIALAQIDQTIEATRVAVRRNPGDPIAVGYLLAAYSKKIDYLRDTARAETDLNRPF